jgi:hypothetical protein
VVPVPLSAGQSVQHTHIWQLLRGWLRLHRFSKNEWSKITALLGLTLALIYLGGLGLYTVSGRPLHEAFWEVPPHPHP